MSRASIVRATTSVCLVALLGVTAAGQSTRPKTPPKKPAAKTPAAEIQQKPAPAATDIRIRTKYTSGAQVSENTTYVKGARQRVEFPGVVTIEQCDLARTLLINPTSKTYLVNQHPAPTSAVATTSARPPDAAQPAGQAQGGAPRSKGGIVTVTTAFVDRGERKPLFGHEARHVTTTMTKAAGPTACDKTPVTVEVDGWYIDLPTAAQCPIGSARPVAAPPKPDACVDQVESHTTGEARLGFPVAMTTTTRTGEGEKQESETSSMEVTALETTSLDAALFDVPVGYTEVRTNAELMSGFHGGGGLTDALLGSTADGTSTAAPKRSGVIRIGVLEPVDKSAHNLPTRELRQQLAADFHKTPFEALTLAATSVADSQAEAGRMQCDYVLYSEIVDIRTSKPGKVGGLLKKVSRDGPPRDVHEVKLDYKLYPAVGGSPALADSVKATSGGGFDIHSAFRLAMFAGSLYLRFTGLGLLNPMLLSNFGVGLGPLAGSGLFDPRMNAMSSLAQVLMSPEADAAANGAGGATPAAADPEIEIRQTVDTALVNAAKGTMEQLQKKGGR